MDAISSVRRASALADLEAMNWFTSIRWLAETESTNKQLAEELRNASVTPPALLVADRQTGGLGRGGNRWFSPEGCLMFSMAIPFNPKATSLLPLEVGMVVARTLAPGCLSRPQVKWPNDVYIDGRKICGVLIDVVQSSSVAIVGIGINCSVSFESAPEPIRQTATSLHLCRPNRLDSDASPESILTQFLSAWREWESNRIENETLLLDSWPEWSLLDRMWVTVENAVTLSNHTRIEGLCLGIDSSGALKIAEPNGRVTPVIAGTIASFRTP
ncbi:biotin--[acetyl-CoA-carboxylase] ligase [Pirellulaceae bacterium SH467]